MKKHFLVRLSFWAKSHRALAIALIAFSKIAIGTIGLSLGLLAALEGITLPLELKWLLFIVAAASILAYPDKQLKKQWGRSKYYRRQKTMDGALVAFGFVTLFFAGNLAPAWVAQPQSAASDSARMRVALSSIKITPEKSREGFLKTGKITRWVKTKAALGISKFARAADEMDVVGKILLTILLLVAAFALTAIVAGLSCSLSCSGQEGLAFLVGFAGFIGIILGLIFGFRAIWRNREGEMDRRHREKQQRTKIDRRHREKRRSPAPDQK